MVQENGIVLPPCQEAVLSTKRQDLIDAAETLFASRGYGNTQISEIAKQAKTGISTFYRYFENKEALLSVLVAQLFAPIGEQLRDRRAGIESVKPRELIERVRQTYELAFDELLARPQLTLILFSSGFGVSSAMSDSVRRELDSLTRDLAVDLDRANESGVVAIPDTEAFARGNIGLILHLAHDHITTGHPTRDTAIDVSTRMTLGGIMTYARPTAQLTLGPIIQFLLARQSKKTP